MEAWPGIGVGIRQEEWLVRRGQCTCRNTGLHLRSSLLELLKGEQAIAIAATAATLKPQ